MPLHNVLEEFLFSSTGEFLPDGRPLYAYKCKEEDYQGIQKLVQEMLPEVLKGYFEPSFTFNQLFCIYAAESWRRKHEGGPWKWETVFADIFDFVPEHRHIVKWVRNGLAYWGRPILKSGMGHNEYLVTIACEGGLPLLLLQKENAHLYRYFKNLLEFYHRERHNPSCNASHIARRLSTILPRSLRHDIVFNLGGDLVKKIVDLQEEVADAINPIQTLDRTNESWRDSLPLPVEDGTVQLLLKNLVQEARSLSVTERQRVRWRRFVRVGEKVTIEQQLEIPKIFSGSFLQHWGNRSELPARMKLLIQTDKGPESVALITRLHGEGENSRYRCELLRRGGIRMTDDRALARVQLFLSDGVSETAVPIQGENEWGPLPWVFADRKGQWEFIGEGSVRCKDENVLVLVPVDSRIMQEAGTLSFMGEAPELKRELWQAAGTVVWEHDELGVCRIRCANQDAADITYLLYGRTLPGTAEQTPPYLGVPRLYIVNQNNARRIVEDAFAEWRPHKLGGKSWHRDIQHCAGEVWLRWANTAGEQLLCRKVRVVPSKSAIKITKVGVDQQLGALHITGFSEADISIGIIPGCEFNHVSEYDKIEIHCIADTGLPIAQFLASIFWPDGRYLEIELPFPQEGAAFVYGNRILPSGDRVPLAKLGTIQAIAQGPLGVQKFDLKVRIKSGNHLLSDLKILRTLSVDDTGRCRFQLHRLQDRISSMLALTGELDSIAILKIVGQSNQLMANLEAGQFDMAWEAQWEQHRLLIPESCTERLETNWEERLKVRMVPLWNPAAEPISLKKGESDSERVIPEDLEPGPWWVLGEDGDWARFRPLLWVIPGEPAPTDSPLKRAILADDQETREVLLRGWVEQISLDSEHSDWSLFFDYLKLLRPYPACALDLFRHFVRSPQAIVLALLKSSDENFNHVWSLTDQLPFSWYLLPANAWLSSARKHFGALRVALDKIESGDETVWQHFQTFRERVTVQRPFFRQICDWLCPTIFPGKKLDNSELQIARDCPQMIDGLIQIEEQNLQSRHDADETYPDGPETMLWTEEPGYPKEHAYRHMADLFRPVRCAPFVAAHISLFGEVYDEALLFELKRLRDFDRDWFTAVFAFALCLGLSDTTAA